MAFQATKKLCLAIDNIDLVYLPTTYFIDIETMKFRFQQYFFASFVNCSICIVFFVSSLIYFLDLFLSMQRIL